MEEYYEINHLIDSLWDQKSANTHSPTKLRRINDQISENAIKIITLWSNKYVSYSHREEFFSLMLDRLVSMLSKEKGTHPGAINCFSKVLSTAMKMCYRRALHNANNPNTNYIQFSNTDGFHESDLNTQPSTLISDNSFDLEERLIAREVLRKAPTGVYGFSPRETQVFESVFGNDFVSFDQTGRDLGISRGSVNTMVSRIAEKIKKVEGLYGREGA